MPLNEWVFSDNPVDWLVWVQAIATIVLTAITGVYVRLTYIATARQAASAVEAVALGKRQADTDLLSRYVPIQSAVGAALGNVRARRKLPMNVASRLTPDHFANAVSHADGLGAAMASTLRIAQVTLGQAQAYSDALVSAATKLGPDHQQVELSVKMLEIHLDVIEEMLQALSTELGGTIDALRLTTGLADVTFSHLGPGTNQAPN